MSSIYSLRFDAFKSVFNENDFLGNFINEKQITYNNFLYTNTNNNN